ncbi:probable rRNA-processing protein EBP2 [Tetranychus urticae]|uniref:Uncharacterized protein n=1 Tax=Tetranychus urticae TaxID=32264 RepID=T1KTY9_TETUR|nr:probable rRNA-processing protein EBP2 [Tetranychus urticae]
MFSSQINPGLMINNKAAILRKLKEINLNYDWFETLETNPTTETLVDDEVDHDFNREMHFYRQAQASVLESLKRLHSLNVPTKRPENYFAEMAKSDQLMLKVKKALCEREYVLSKIARIKKLRNEKHGAKMEKRHERHETKQNETPKKGKPVKKISKKALHKKKVYGCAGGQKKRSKYNTAESAANVSHGKKGKPKIYKKKFNTNRF